jgi:hypothetical protein
MKFYYHTAICEKFSLFSDIGDFSFFSTVADSARKPLNTNKSVTMTFVAKSFLLVSSGTQRMSLMPKNSE